MSRRCPFDGSLGGTFILQRQNPCSSNDDRDNNNGNSDDNGNGSSRNYNSNQMSTGNSRKTNNRKLLGSEIRVCHCSASYSVNPKP